MLKTKIIASLLSFTMLSSALITTSLTIKNNNKTTTNSVLSYINNSTDSMNSAKNEIINLQSKLVNLEVPINNLSNQLQKESSINYQLEKKHEFLLKELNSLLGKSGNVKLSNLEYNLKNSKYLYNNADNCRFVIYHILADYLHIPYYKLYGINSFILNEFGNNIITTPPTGTYNPEKIIDSIAQSNILLNANKSVNKAACFNLIDFILINDLGYPRDGWGLTIYSVQEVNYSINQLLNGTFTSVGGIISRILGHEIFATKNLYADNISKPNQKHITDSKNYYSNLLKNTIALKNNNCFATAYTTTYISSSISSMDSAIYIIKKLCSLILSDKQKISLLHNEIYNLNNQNNTLLYSNANLEKEINDILGSSNPKLYHVLFNLRDSKLLYNNKVNAIKIIDYIANNYLKVPSKYNFEIRLQVNKQYKNNTFKTPPTGTQSTGKIIHEIVTNKILLNSNGTINEKQCYNLINFILEDDLGYQRSGTGFFTYSIQEVDTAIKELSNGTFFDTGKVVNRIWHDIFAKKDNISKDKLSNNSTRIESHTKNIHVINLENKSYQPDTKIIKASVQVDSPNKKNLSIKKMKKVVTDEITSNNQNK